MSAADRFPSRERVEALRRIQQPRPLPRWRRLLHRIGGLR